MACGVMMLSTVCSRSRRLRWARAVDWAAKISALDLGACCLDPSSSAYGWAPETCVKVLVKLLCRLLSDDDAFVDRPFRPTVPTPSKTHLHNEMRTDVPLMVRVRLLLSPARKHELRLLAQLCGLRRLDQRSRLLVTGLDCAKIYIAIKHVFLEIPANGGGLGAIDAAVLEGSCPHTRARGVWSAA